MTNPTTQADNEFSASLKVTDPLKYAILKQSFEYAGDVVNNPMESKCDVSKLKNEMGKEAADSVKQKLPVRLKRAMREVLLPGSQPSPFKTLASDCTKVPSRMPWLFATTGNSHGSPPLVLVVPSSQLNMPCPVPKVASPRFDIMKYKT